MAFETSLSGWPDLLRGRNFSRLLILWLAVWLEAADSLVTSTIMPTVAAELGGLRYLGWATGGFLVGAIVAGASAGKLSELLGLKRAMTLGGAVLAAGCMISAVAPAMGIFLGGRILQGVGGGWIAGLSMVAIAMLFPERHLARVFASVAAIWGVATLLGPLIGGMVVEHASWRLVFWLFAVQAGALLVAVPLIFGGLETGTPGTRMPRLQLAVLLLGMAAFAYASSQSSTAAALAALGAGSLCLAAALLAERRSTAPLLPANGLSLGSTAGAGYAAMLLFAGSAMPLVVYGPVVLQTLHGLSPLGAGYVIAIQAGIWTVAAFFAAAASPAREGLTIRLGAVCIVLGTFMLAGAMPTAPLPAIVAAVAVQGAGFGLSSSLMSRRVLRTLTDEDREIGSSALMAVRQIGGAIGAAIATVAATAAGLAESVTEGGARNAALWVNLSALPFALLAALAAWRMTEKKVPSPGGPPTVPDAASTVSRGPTTIG